MQTSIVLINNSNLIFSTVFRKKIHACIKLLQSVRIKRPIDEE
jgi:hypothetical protein